MSCLGVHFALTDGEVAILRSFENEHDRLGYLQEVIEEQYLTGEKTFAAETDKAWDAMHRALADGTLNCKGGEYPLNFVVLGGESLYLQSDYIMSLKMPQQVHAIADVVRGITEEEFRRRYFAIDAEKYGFPISKEDFGYTWEWFQGVRGFYWRAAEAGRYVLSTAD